ncbi:O-antigen ligase family protein [Celeribacter sp.]|uniref:O-antigen ligase family protein n=1 Tax=Celeribacter sp. TaxID=1890673 RepID=UPI003A90DD7E
MALIDINSKPQHDWRADRRSTKISLSALSYATVNSVFTIYVFLELRMWFWGSESTLGTFIPPANMAAYQGGKLISILAIVTVAIILKSGQILSQSVSIIMLLLWCGLSILWSPAPIDGIIQYVLILVPVFFAATTARLFEAEQQIHLLAKILALAMVFNIAFTTIVPSIGIMSDYHDGRLRGLMMHKNHFGAYSSFAFCYFWQTYKIFGIGKYLFLALFAIACVAFSGSASAIVMLVLAITIQLLATAVAKFSTADRKPIIVVLLVILPIALWVTNIFRDDILLLLGRDPTLTQRSGIWAVVLDYLRSNPFTVWFGEGPSGANGNAELIRLMQSLSGYSQVTSTHSSYFDIVISFGIIGLTLFTYLVAKTLILAISVLATTKDNIILHCCTLCIQLIILFLSRNFVTSEAGLSGSFPFLIFVCAYFTLKSITDQRAG